MVLTDNESFPFKYNASTAQHIYMLHRDVIPYRVKSICAGTGSLNPHVQIPVT